MGSVRKANLIASIAKQNSRFDLLKRYNLFMSEKLKIDSVGLKQLLIEMQCADIDLHVFDVVDSTQKKALLSRGLSTELFVANMQTGGLGRNNKHWLSIQGSQILLSLVWRYNNVPKHLSAISLVVASVVVQVLQENVDAAFHLKWPNDIYLNEKKIAGILIDVVTSKKCKLVIGLGLNFNLSKSICDENGIADLSNVGLTLTREELIASIVINLSDALKKYPVKGFSDWQEMYNQKALYIDEKVTLIHSSAGDVLSGVYKGVCAEGCLTLLDDNNVIHKIWDSAWSLRAK